MASRSKQTQKASREARMRGRLVIKTPMLAVVASLVAVSVAPAAPGWQLFLHPGLGFSISYPSGWVTPSAGAGIHFIAVGPPVTGVSTVRLNVNITAEPISPGISVVQYEEANEASMRLLFHGYRRLRSDRTQLNGLPSVVRYFTWRRADGVELYQIQLVTVTRTLGYVVTGTTASSSTRLREEATLLRTIMLTFRPRR